MEDAAGAGAVSTEVGRLVGEGAGLGTRTPRRSVGLFLTAGTQSCPQVCPANPWGQGEVPRTKFTVTTMWSFPLSISAISLPLMRLPQSGQVRNHTYGNTEHTQPQILGFWLGCWFTPPRLLLWRSFSAGGSEDVGVKGSMNLVLIPSNCAALRCTITAWAV